MVKLKLQRIRQVKLTLATLLFSIVFASSLLLDSSAQIANAGIFSCSQAKKWSKYSELRNSFLRNPEQKSDQDWFRSYIFARIYTGYSNCFSSKDVQVMTGFVQLINNTCQKNPNWSYVCSISGGSGKLSKFTYMNYK